MGSVDACYGDRHRTAQRAHARAIANVLCGMRPLSCGQCPSTTLRVWLRPSCADAQRFTPAALLDPVPRYLTLSALGFGAGGASAQEVLAEISAARPARAQACRATFAVTFPRHCEAIALIALTLARFLATAVILSGPAQALSSPRRSAL